MKEWFLKVYTYEKKKSILIMKPNFITFENNLAGSASL